jgi:hypothetical protein
LVASGVDLQSMPILSISGQTLEFQAFWCDARDPSGLEPGLIALAFAQSLRADCGLAVTGDYGGKRHGLLLCEPAKGRSEGRSLIGVPVPAEWNNFDLILTPFAAAAVGPPITLQFARQAPQGAVPAATGNVLHVVAARSRIETRLRTGNAGVSSQLRLYQYTAADKIFPSKRTANFSNTPYHLELRLPQTSIVMDPWPQRAGPDDSALKIELYARDEDAIRAIGDSLLWYASQAQLAPSDPSALGTFGRSEEHGFIAIKDADVRRPKPDVMEFTVRGATPGDVFCLAPGLEYAAISLGSDLTLTPETLDTGLMVFELNRDGRAVRLAGSTLQRVNSNGAFDRGTEHETDFEKPLLGQLARIRRQWAGGKNAIGSLADSFAANMGSGHRGDVIAIEETADSPAQFALCAVLLDELLRRAGVEAASLAAIIRPGQARIAERICSAATWRAAGDEPSRTALSRLTAGTYYPWHAPDGFRTLFETVFQEPASGSDQDAADRWYRQTDGNPVARAALLAVERQASEGAWILIRAQVMPDLADLGTDDLAGVIAFCQSQLLQRPGDLALSDAIRFACGALEQNPELSRVAAELLDRIKNLEAAAPVTSKMFLAVDQLRRLRAAIDDDALAARLGQIRDALELDDANVDIPRFEQGRPPLEGGAGAADLIEKLNKKEGLPDHWNLLRADATSAPWPAATLAALLATLTHHAAKEPFPRQGRQGDGRQRDIPDNDALLNAAATGDPQTEADAKAVGLLLDGTAAASEFIEQLRIIVAEHERELSNSGIGGARKQTAARAAAHIRLTGIVQEAIKERLQQVKKISDVVADALDRATRDTNDPNRQSRLGDISRAKVELDNRYRDVRLALIDRRNSGRAVLDKKALEEVEGNLKMALNAWHELSRLRARIRAIYPHAAGESLPPA